MSKLVVIVMVTTTLLGMTGCEHVDFEVDWAPLLESIATQITK